MHRFASTFLVSLLTVVPAAFAQSTTLSPRDNGQDFSASTNKSLSTNRSSSVADRAVLAAYGKLPLSFEQNLGQTDAHVKFLSRGLGYTLYLTEGEAVLSLPRALPQDIGKLPTAGNSAIDALTQKFGAQPQAMDAAHSVVLSSQLVGANPKAKILGMEDLPGKSNYIIGKDSTKWRADVPTYAKIKYQDIYPGVDLVYYGNRGGRLENDFLVAPGADLQKIRIAIIDSENAPKAGAEDPAALRIDLNGDLVVAAPGGEVRYQRPAAYQINPKIGPEVSSDGAKHLIDARYVLKAKNEVGFELDPYDAKQPLVIDPALVYSTFLTGNFYDEALAVAVDSSGSAYVTGFTFSSVPTFPVTSGAYQTTCGTDGTCNYRNSITGTSNTDAFVTKFTVDGSALVYSTYLGGSYDEQGQAIAVDANGNAYVTGYTRSYDFPTTTGALQTTCAPYVVVSGTSCTVIPGSACAGAPNAGRFAPLNVVNAFVTKLNATGSGLAYSTFLGGWGNSNATGIALNAVGEVYIAGSTDAQQQQGFTDSGGCPAGYQAAHPTTASGFFHAPPLSATPNGMGWPSRPGVNGFFSKLSADGTTLKYSTYLGSPCTLSGTTTTCIEPYVGQGANGVAVDSAGDAYVTGSTNSPTFSTTSGAFQTVLNQGGGTPGGACGGANCNDGFVVKFDPTQSGAASLVYSTLLGGSGDDTGLSIAVDSTNNAYVTGEAGYSAAPSPDFPTTPGAFQATCPAPCSGFDKIFVTKLNPAGTGLAYSSYLGGSSSDDVSTNSIALDSSGRAYVAGSTNSTNFPTNNSTQASPGAPGASNAFVTVFKPDGSGLAFSTFLGGSAYTFGTGLALDPAANIYVSGYTLDQNFPTTANAFQTTCAHCGVNGSNRAGFVTKFSALQTNTTSPLTITADNESRMYGAANPLLTFTPSGLLNGDTLASLGVTVTCSTTATVSSSVGSYPIACSGPSSASNYAIAYPAGTLSITPATLTVTANNATKILDGPNPSFSSSISGFVNGDTTSVLAANPTCSTTATSNSPVGSYAINCSGASAANYQFSYVPSKLKIVYASGGLCDGAPGHQILPPINADGTTVGKQGRTVPAKFSVCDANGLSIGTVGVVSSFYLTGIQKGTVTTAVESIVDTNNPDTAFRWDPTDQQWIFNITTANLSAGSTYIYTITLNDGSAIVFQFGLR